MNIEALTFMERSEGSPNTVVTISKEGKTMIDANARIRLSRMSL